MNEEGQGENPQRDLARQPPGSRPGDIVLQPRPAVINLRDELPNYVAGLSTEQRKELWITLRSGYMWGRSLSEPPMGQS